MLVVAYLIGRWALREYAHKFSPKKFTQPQLFACLVLKEFLQLDYRKLAALLADCRDLAAEIDLKTVPHFTTPHRFANSSTRPSMSHGSKDDFRRAASWRRWTAPAGRRIT